MHWREAQAGEALQAGNRVSGARVTVEEVVLSQDRSWDGTVENCIRNRGATVLRKDDLKYHKRFVERTHGFPS